MLSLLGGTTENVADENEHRQSGKTDLDVNCGISTDGKACSKDRHLFS